MLLFAGANMRPAPALSRLAFAMGMLAIFLAGKRPSASSRWHRAMNRARLGASAIMTPLWMALVFFFVFLPVGFFLRLIKKNTFTRGFDPDLESYWISRGTHLPHAETMRHQV